MIENEGALLLGYLGLGDHPDASKAGWDLTGEMLALGEQYVKDWADEDPLARAMLHPGYRTWEWEPVPVDVLQPGQLLHGPGGLCRFETVLEEFHGVTLVRVRYEPTSPFHDSRPWRFEWTPDCRALVPVPIDATMLSRGTVTAGSDPENGDPV